MHSPNPADIKDTLRREAFARRDVAPPEFPDGVAWMEDEFRIEISDRDSEGLRTVGDVLALIRTKLH